MERDVVIVGGARGAVRAALASALRGHRVTWLVPDLPQEERPDLPEGRGCVESVVPPWQTAEAVLGPLEALPDPPCRALVAGGRIHPLPFRPRGLSGILGPSRTGAAAWGLARVRTREAMGGLSGAWSEVRSYRDWVTWRYGEPIFQALYAPYCARRWGSPEEVGAAVARLYHGTLPAAVQLAPQEGPAACLSRARAAVEEGGGHVIGGVHVRGLDVRGGRVASVRLGGRRPIRVDGPILVACPPSVIASWLGDSLTDPIRAHAGRLAFRHALQVLVPASEDDLPDEIHLASPGCTFFSVTRPGRLPAHRDLTGHVLVHGTVTPADALWTASDAEVVAAAREALGEIPAVHVRPGEATVRRHEADEPCWTLASTPSWLRVRAAFAALGVVGVGRAGTFGHLDPLGEIRFLEAILDGVPLAEAHRLHVDPPFEASRKPGELPGFIHR
jgi:hypothetical protein